MHLFIWEPLFYGRRQKLSPPYSAPAPAPLACARFGGRSQGRADLWRPDPSVDHAARALKIQMRAIVQVPRRRGPQGATTDDGPPKLGSALLRADAPLPFTAAPRGPCPLCGVAPAALSRVRRCGLCGGFLGNALRAAIKKAGYLPAPCIPRILAGSSHVFVRPCFRCSSYRAPRGAPRRTAGAVVLRQPPLPPPSGRGSICLPPMPLRVSTSLFCASVFPLPFPFGGHAPRRGAWPLAYPVLRHQPPNPLQRGLHPRPSRGDRLPFRQALPDGRSGAASRLAAPTLSRCTLQKSHFWRMIIIKSAKSARRSPCTTS